MTEYKLYDYVEILKTHERGFIVWYDEDDPQKDSYLIEIKDKNEMPLFYERKDFVKVEEREVKESKKLENPRH